MSPALQILIPVAMFILMTVVGMELTSTDFKRVLQFPTKILIACAAQIIGLPLLAMLLIWAFGLGPEAILALVVFAACPGGGISNALTVYARGNVAFSVSLTAMTCALTLLTLPLVIGLVLWLLLGESKVIAVPILPLMAQLILLVLIPVSLGLRIRARHSAWVLRHYRKLQRLNLVLLIGILGLSLRGEDGVSLMAVAHSLPVAAVFVAGSLLIAYITAKLSRMSYGEAVALGLEFLVRNGAIMMLILVGILHRPDLLPLPGACVALQLSLAPLLVLFLRRRQAASA